MISKKMKELLEKSASMSAMFSEGKRMAERLGAENVFDFGIGNPNVKAPPLVNQTAIHLLETVDSLTLHGYTDGSGIPAVRQAIAESLNRRFQESYTKENIVMTTGAAGGLNVIFKVLLEPMDEVLTFAPYFSEYDGYVDNAGGVLRVVPPNPPTFLPDMELFSKGITAKTKVVLINSPNNPTGIIYDEKTICAMAEILRNKQIELGTTIYIISDEPYRELVYDEGVVPYIPKFYDNTIVAYSFSKSLSLPGDRIGYLTIPDAVSDSRDIVYGAGIGNRILGFVNAPALQQLVVAACCDEKTDVAYYDGNRSLLYDGLREMGYECAKPQGAFYLFVKALETDEIAFAEKAKAYGLLLLPGRGFGCPGYVRIAYCVARETIVRSLPAFEKLARAYSK